MDGLRALYMTPWGSIEGLSDDVLFEDDWNLNHSEKPDFTVDREQALFLIGTRSGIIEWLRREGCHRVTITDGTVHLSVREGASDLEKHGRTALGAVKGAGAVVSKPVRHIIKALPKFGPIATVADVFSASPNPWRGASYDMARRIKNERAKLLSTVVQVSCAASNVHSGPARNAFAAAARPQAGAPAPLSNSNIMLAQLADMLESDHGF
jgi:hypothetical protein